MNKINIYNHEVIEDLRFALPHIIYTQLYDIVAAFDYGNYIYLSFEHLYDVIDFCSLALSMLDRNNPSYDTFYSIMKQLIDQP